VQHAVGIDHHRAEFPAAEDLARSAETMMAEEHRPTVRLIKPRDHQHRRRDADQQQRCHHQIEDPLRADTMDCFAFPRIFWTLVLLCVSPPQLTENCRVEHSRTFATEESSSPTCPHRLNQADRSRSQCWRCLDVGCCVSLHPTTPTKRAKFRGAGGPRISQSCGSLRIRRHLLRHSATAGLR